MKVSEYFDGKVWSVTAELRDGDDTQYFHSFNESHADALANVIAQAKSYKSYEVEI